MPDPNRPTAQTDPNVRPKGAGRRLITPGPNIIAVASGKGGVGKTWLSITLTQALSRYGRKGLLFDGDVGLANVDIQLGLMPKRDLAAVLNDTIKLKTAATPFERGGFDVIAGRSGSGSLANVSPQRLAEVQEELGVLARSYGNVVIDIGAGIDRTVRQLAAQAQTVLVVTTEEPTSLTDAYALIKVMQRDRPDADIRVVVNMAQTRADGQRTYETLAKACRNFLKFTPRLAGIVRQDRHVRESIRSQLPLLTRSPNAEAAQDVEVIAAKLSSPS